MASFLYLKFLEVPDDGQIVTKSFLDSCQNILPFFDHLGVVFTPFRMDLKGNIDKVRKRLLENPEKFKTLELIIDTERAETNKRQKLIKHGNQGIATNALMWLRRTLHFMSRFFNHLLNKDYPEPPSPEEFEKLGACSLFAYKESLERYHGWLGRCIFASVKNAVPDRRKFPKDIGGVNSTEEQTLDAMKEFTINFDMTISAIEEMYKHKGAEQDCIV